MIEAVFFDLSGVLYTGTTAIDGAVDAIDRVQASSLQVRFVTNTSRQTRADLLKGLLRMGFDLSSEQLYTAPSAALSWVVEHGRRPYCLVHENILPEFAGVDQSSPDAVIIGDAADDLNYKNLNHAFQLCQQGAVLIGIGRNRYFKQNDELVLDAGPFINAIEYAADTEAIIMGKPSPAFFRQIVNSVDCKASEVLMMGDDVFGDVEGALRSGLQACLVQTGKYQLGDETRIDGVFTVYPSIVEAVDMLLGGHIQ
jgi:HAD superfamily hydrolase (TIGR01458 family)